jgi:hypothetical protein
MLEHPRGTPPYCSTQHESKGRAGYGQRVRFLVESSDFCQAAAGSRLRQDLPAIPFCTRKIGHNGNRRDVLAIKLRSDGVSMATGSCGIVGHGPIAGSTLSTKEQGVLNGL